MYRRSLAAVLAAAFLVGLPCTVVAQDRTDRLTMAGLAVPRGATVATLDSDAIRASGARMLPELLTGRVAGLTVTYESGVFGTQARIHVRGSTGTIGAPEPLLYIDGVLIRHDPEQYAAPLRGLAGLSRTLAFDWEIPVEEIERVDVVMGAAGGALLEFGAARGAVLVTTRRPTDGAMRLRASIETLLPSAAPEFDANYGTTSIEQPDDPQYCTLARQATGGCTPGTLQRWSPLDEAGIFTQPKSGTRANVQTRGALFGGAFHAGVDAARTATITARDGRDVFGLGAAYARPIGPKLDASFDTRMLHASGYFAPWLDYIAGGTDGESADDSIGGFSYVNPAELVRRHPVLSRGRVEGAASLRWRPTSRLTVNGRLTFDRADRTLTVVDRDGSANGTPSRQAETTRDDGFGLAANASYSHRMFGIDATLEGMAASRASWLRNRMEYRVLSSPNLIGSSGTSVRDRQVGLALRERFDLTPTISVAVGGRFDRLTADDREPLDLGLRPTAEASWKLSDERFFPKNPIVGTVRFHAAHGTSIDANGVRAAMLDPVDASTPLRLERFTETEVGTELTLLRGALALDATVHERRQSDAVVPYPVGVIFTSYDLRQSANWSVRGADLRLSIAPLKVGPIEWQSTVVASFLSYGDFNSDFAGFLDLRDAYTMSGYTNGEPFNRLRTTRTTWSDANDDGVITYGEIAPGPGESISRAALPTRLFGATTSIGIGGRVTVGAQFDAQLGQWKVNEDDWVRCVRRLCRAAHDPEASLYEQARAVATFAGVPAGGFYLEDASFVKLREAWVRISLTGLLPRALGREANLLLSARNLATWTDYTGADPEAGQFLGPSSRHGEYFAMPLVRTVTVRLQMAW